MTVGLCMDIVEIGLAVHLRYIRPCTRTYVRTDRIATRTTKGGGAPPQAPTSPAAPGMCTVHGHPYVGLTMCAQRFHWLYI